MNRWSSYNLAADATAGSIGLMAGVGVLRALPTNAIGTRHPI
jgi:hypothetical protein